MVGSLGRVMVHAGVEDVTKIPNPLAAFDVPDVPTGKARIITGSH